MDKSEKLLNNCQNMESTFEDLEQILYSTVHSITDKCSAWRQQSLVVKSFNDSLANDLMERHWIHNNSSMNKTLELQNHESDALNENRGNSDLEFPNINIQFLKDKNAHSDMFKDIRFEDIQKPINEFNIPLFREINNKTEESVYTSINTLGRFLHVPKSEVENQQLSFCSARQLLSEQILKKHMKKDGTINRQHNFKSVQKPNVGFNFAASKPDLRFNTSGTKKSLGSLGRLVGPTRKNLGSPVRSKTITPPDMDEKNQETVNSKNVFILSHPALKNVDCKMVDLIENEIIHKFKPVDWNEIAGLEYAKSIIKEAVVYPLLRPDIFTGLRRPPRGILLFGPPGTGKTLIGKCIASQSCSTFFSISSASLTSKWMGEGEKMVRALFAVAVARQPSVVFIDEIDSLLSQRSENENEGTRRLKTEFLVRLDGAATLDDDRVLIVGATNRPQELDEAVRRRFVKRLYVPLPEIDARAEILENLLKTVENNLHSNDIKEISQLAVGYSGADMDSLCREASMEPLRSLPAEAIISFQKEQLRPVNKDDFHNALKKIRPSVSQKDLNQYVEWNKTYGSSY